MFIMSVFIICKEKYMLKRAIFARLAMGYIVCELFHLPVELMRAVCHSKGNFDPS
jgi:hypothetical protein